MTLKYEYFANFAKRLECERPLSLFTSLLAATLQVDIPYTWKGHAKWCKHLGVGFRVSSNNSFVTK